MKVEIYQNLPDGDGWRTERRTYEMEDDTIGIAVYLRNSVMQGEAVAGTNAQGRDHWGELVEVVKDIGPLIG